LKNLQALFASLLLILSSLALQAQPAAVQQLQNSRITQPTPLLPEFAGGTNAPDLYQGENADVGPQRILRIAPRHKYFNLLLDSQIFYTDNANFAPTRQKIGSTVFVNTAQAIFSPRDWKLESGRISTAIGFASQWYNYENDQMSPLDFNAQTAFGGAKYAFGNWLVALDMSYTRLVNQSDYYLTYQELLPAFTLQRFFPINDTMLITLSDQVDYHFTDEPATFATYTEINNRLDNILSLTFTWQMARNLYLQPAYRFVFTNYRYNTLQDSDRNDYLNSLGLSLSYYFNQNFSIRTFFNYNVKSSNDPYAAAYHETDGGLGAAVNILF
jgi:hypothetical protein